MKNLFITGGTGFLGRALAEKFIQKGWRVTLFDNLPLQDSELALRVKVVLGDIRDVLLVQKEVAEQDVVIHAAAALPSHSSKKTVFEINVGGMRNVLTAIEKSRVQKIIYISTTAVYGVPRACPVDETYPSHPMGDYGVSKAEAEVICKQFYARGYSIIILRPATFLGPGRLGLFQILFEWIHRGNIIYMIGNGTNRYQLLALSDLVEAIWLVVNNLNCSETFNLGAEQFGTVREDLQQLINYAKSHSVLLPLPAKPIQGFLRLLKLCHLSPLVEWHYRTASEDSYVSIFKAKQLLGWQPQKSNVDALMESYNEYCKNRTLYLGRRGVTHSVSWNPKLLRIFQIPARWTKWLRN